MPYADLPRQSSATLFPKILNHHTGQKTQTQIKVIIKEKLSSQNLRPVLPSPSSRANLTAWGRRTFCGLPGLPGAGLHSSVCPACRRSAWREPDARWGSATICTPQGTRRPRCTPLPASHTPSCPPRRAQPPAINVDVTCDLPRAGFELASRHTLAVPRSFHSSPASRHAQPRPPP